MHLLPVSRMKKVNPFKHSVLFNGTSANSAEPDQTPQNAASDQALHYLLTEGSIKIWIEWENTTQQPLKQNLTCPIDKDDKSH